MIILLTINYIHHYKAVSKTTEYHGDMFEIRFQKINFIHMVYIIVYLARIRHIAFYSTYKIILNW